MLKRWLMILAIPVVFQVVFLVALLKVQIDASRAQFWAFHTKDVITHAETLNRLLVAVRSNMLGLAMSGSAELNPYEPIARKIPPEVDALGDLVKDNRSQAERVQKLRASVREYLAWMDETFRQIRLGKPERERWLARIQTQGGKQRLDALQALLAEFRGAEETLGRDRQAELERSGQWLFGLMIGGMAVSLVIIVVLVDAFSRGFARRVAALADNARRLAEGKPLVAPIGGDDELGQLANVFDNMARSLAEREQENEMFIYSVSHDLRSPLVNLQGFSKELTYTADDIRQAVEPLEKSPAVAARIARLLDKDMPDSIHFIQNAVSRLSRIIDSLLGLSRAGRVEYRMQKLGMNAITSRVVEALRGSTAEKGAEIVVGHLPDAWGDATAIEQVVANLLSNAVKYLDPARPGRIEVGAEPGGGGGSSGGDADALVTYHVRDNGLGIPPAHQAKLFLAFQRLHPGVATGEGIGLALVKRIVLRHGGKIWVESEAGIGSTFFVTLPAPPPGTADESPTKVAAATGARE